MLPAAVDSDTREKYKPGYHGNHSFLFSIRISENLIDPGLLEKSNEKLLFFEGSVKMFLYTELGLYFLIFTMLVVLKDLLSVSEPKSEAQSLTALCTTALVSNIPPYEVTLVTRKALAKQSWI